MAALCRCIVDNYSGWGCLLDLQDGCNILRTALMILSWYLIVDVFIDGLMDLFVRTEDLHRLLVAVSNDFLTLAGLLEHNVVDRLQLRHRRDIAFSIKAACGETLITDQ